MIPKKVREKLGLGVGGRVLFIEDSRGGFRIVAAKSDVRALKGIVTKPRVPVSVEEMQKAMARRAVRSIRDSR
ncbi:MAG: AbrB family transcriptional regulator [Burkholderiales bacterium]|nr:AbrB family transcriptional regulator [Burkholderiales bacterium]